MDEGDAEAPHQVTGEVAEAIRTVVDSGEATEEATEEDTEEEVVIAADSGEAIVGDFEVVIVVAAFEEGIAVEAFEEEVDHRGSRHLLRDQAPVRCVPRRGDGVRARGEDQEGEGTATVLCERCFESEHEDGWREPSTRSAEHDVAHAEPDDACRYGCHAPWVWYRERHTVHRCGGCERRLQLWPVPRHAPNPGVQERSRSLLGMATLAC